MDIEILRTLLECLYFSSLFGDIKIHSEILCFYFSFLINPVALFFLLNTDWFSKNKLKNDLDIQWHGYSYLVIFPFGC